MYALILCGAALAFLASADAQEKTATEKKAREVAPGIFTAKGKPKIVAEPLTLPEDKTVAKTEMKSDGKVDIKPIVDLENNPQKVEEKKIIPFKSKKKARPIFRPTLKAKDVIEASMATNTEARTFTLTVPAPRGQIIDRNGYPLAQSEVAYYAAINFPQLKDATDREIARYALERVNKANQVLGGNWDLQYKTVLEHYRDRRWLPLVFSSPLNANRPGGRRRINLAPGKRSRWTGRSFQ